MIFVLLSSSGCTSSSKAAKNDTYFYMGQGNSWLATYSIIKVKSSYYDSLSIQYLFDDNAKSKEEKVGPIEYKLIGNSMELKSSYPQELHGVCNFHNGSKMNVDIFKVAFDNYVELIVKWQGKSEIIKLERQN